MDDVKYSVLMSVYSRENAAFFRDAMNSIWVQTIPADDFVLVCDGPLTTELDEVISEMEKAHSDILQIIRLKENSGLSNALNEGMKHCKNELIARMDSDDISCPDRCEKQLKIFHEDPETDLCSGNVIEFADSIDHITGKRELPETNDEIIAFSRKRNPFNHPAVMYKKTAVEAAGGYSGEYPLFEDYYLWIRMLMNGSRGRNIAETILYMRTPGDFYMRRGGKKYAKDMLAFHRWMKDEGWITNRTYVSGAVPHAVICVVPNSLRKAAYRILHT